MIRHILMLAIAIALTCPAFADDAPKAEFESFLDGLSGKQTEVAQSQLTSSPASARLDDIERRLEELERTAIDAQEAEEIAERVVQRYVQQLRLAINKPSGGQRVETVNFSSPSDTQQFQLRPGETLSSYTDVSTGQVVQVGQPTTHVTSQVYSSPVPTWRTNEVVIQSQPAAVTSYRTVAMRPVVQTFSSSPAPVARTTYRRGLFGRQIMRTTANASCQMVNGQMVCN